MTTFYARFAEAARKFPERVAIEFAGSDATVATTYQELLDRSARVARWLETCARIAPGDRVAILAGNDARWIAVYLGVLRRGAVVVPLDTAYSAKQVHTIVADSGARVLFTTPRYVDTAREAAALAGADAPRLVSPRLADGVVCDDEIDAMPADGEPIDAALDQAAALLYTSGTTADPKGVVLTHGNLHAERDGVLSVVLANETDVVLGVLPLFHALAQMANLLLPLTIGARVVFLEQVSSTTLLGALETRGVTILACVPQFFYLIHQRVVATFASRGAVGRRLFTLLVRLNATLRDRIGVNPGRLIFARVHRALGPSMRLLITGGSRFDPAIARDLYGLGVSLYNGYGLTETSGAATIVRVGDRFTTSVGQPLPGVDIRIGERSSVAHASVAPESSAALPEEWQDGEVLIRGPVVMREYWRRPDATADVLHDGWLYTGDLGRLDENDRLYITGRKKDVIVLSSGKNIYPEEVEAHYRQSPFVRELCVLGLTRSDQPAAERLHAVIVPDEQALRDRGVVNLRELIRFELESLSVALPAHKRILSYDLSFEPLARTSTGKLKRGDIERHLRERTSAPTTEREATPEELAWLADRTRAEMAAAIATELHVTRVHPDANLELDLGLDSMERVELLTTLEVRAGRRVAAATRAEIFTARQLIDAVLNAECVERAGASASGDNAALPWDAVLAEAPDAALVQQLRHGKTLTAAIMWMVLRLGLLAARLVLRIHVRGRQQVPAGGPIIVTPNHQSYLDGFLIAAALPFPVLRQIFFVGATEYFETRFSRWVARAINIVPVDPDANLVSAMRAAATGLSLGKVLMLFPEGERSIDGRIRPFRKGAAILASHLHVPILPVAIDGLFAIWPRGRPLQWRRLRFWRRPLVTVTFGAPMTVARGDYAAGTDALQRHVTALMPSAATARE